MNLDMNKVEQFAGQVVGDISATFSGVMTNIGHKLGLALGAQAGEKRLSDVMREAGFKNIRRTAETPFNMVFETRIN